LAAAETDPAGLAVITQLAASLDDGPSQARERDTPPGRPAAPAGEGRPDAVAPTEAPAPSHSPLDAAPWTLLDAAVKARALPSLQSPPADRRVPGHDGTHSAIGRSGGEAALGLSLDTWRPDTQAALERHDLATAEERVRQRLDSHPSDADAVSYDAWLQLARALAGRSDDNPAAFVDQLEDVTRKHPRAPLPHLLAGLAQLSLGNMPQARTYLAQALSLGPMDPHINAADALLRAGYFAHPRVDLAPLAVWRTINRNARVS
jgi:hypothetical protein